MMRAAIPCLLILASCATAPFDEPDPPDLLASLLENADPGVREEAVSRLSIQGGSIPELLEGVERPEKALAYAEEDTASIRQGITRALEDRNHELMVWRAYHALRAGCLARHWSRVSDALSRQGFRLIEIYEPHERAKFVRFLAQPAAYVNGAGDRHDLFFWVQSIRKDDSWIVREIYVGLHVKFDAPFKQLSSTDRYPRGSALARFFELEELQKLAMVFPLLEEIEFTYGRIRLKDAVWTSSGFHLNAGFAMEARKGGRGVYYIARSQLDPGEDQRGRLNRTPFIRGLGAGPLKKQGASFWGGGAPKPTED